jgi:hypothetical protein
MRDTTHMAYTAEDYVAYKLQAAGLLVAKPKFDRDGTDLILLITVENGAKFGRVQCKGRSLRNSHQTNVLVPRDYVKGPFFLFLYLNYRAGEDLYLFFTDDIKDWNVLDDQYVRYIDRNDVDNGSMRSFLFEPSKIDRIVEIIKRTTSELEKEMYRALKMGMEAIKKQDEARKLAELIYEIRSTVKEKELAEKDLAIAHTGLKDLAGEIIATTSTRLVDRIKRFKEDGWTEEATLSELLKDNSIELSNDEMWLLILSLFDSIEKKF